MRNLANDLIRAGKIETTEARAKAIRPQVERLVTFAKKQTLAARRELMSRMHNEKIVNKLYHDIGPRYAARPAAISASQSLQRAASATVQGWRA